MPGSTQRLRLTELLASLSLATDAGTGQPLGHGLRTSLLAVHLAKALGLDGESVRSVQRVSLLRFLGCTSDASETAAMAGGDEIEFNAAMAPVFFGSPRDMITGMVGAVAPGRPFRTKSRMVLAALADRSEPARGLAAHCEVASMLAKRLGLGESVSVALEAAYERWDGKGYPHRLEGAAIPIEVRIAVVARDVDIFRREGMDVRRLLGERRGKAYDPAVVDAFEGSARSGNEADWDAVLGAEPDPISYVADLEPCLEVMGQFADLKSPWTRGHSTKVADLVEAAAAAAGLSIDQRRLLRWAGLVHDLGRVGVENGIWDKAESLSTDEQEKMEFHSYLTDRILSRCASLAPLAALASSHHERLDGSGYHRRSSAAQLSPEARILASADVLAALMAQRPHRPAVELGAAAQIMREEAARGWLDRQAVEWVIGAAGGEEARLESSNPDGLTDREVEVLELLCRGDTNRLVAEKLFISPKTVGRHVENIYAKIGVSSRAGAAVYAMERRLLD